MTSCAQLADADASSGAVVASDRLRHAWPTTSLAGGALLLDGEFQTEFKICFDDRELPPLFLHTWSTMTQVPDGATDGPHTVRLLFADGRLSEAVPTTVTHVPALGASYLDSGGKLASGFGIPSAISTRAPLFVMEPITNMWTDPNSNFEWSMVGDGYYNDGKVDGGRAVDGEWAVRYEGQYDHEHQRLNVTFKGRGMEAEWKYVVLFVCPSDTGSYPVSHPDGSGNLIDACSPEFAKAFKTREEASDFVEFNYLPRRVVFFPLDSPAPQGILIH
ncbi:MAG: hypothetical protein EOO73_05520 [Myxococcales bacterium]|nr:MAG: hypothetical protein EOO73_05520 [Myxococcales bacterium]